MAIVAVTEFETYMEALVAKATLEANGIQCFIPNENTISMRGGMNLGFRGLDPIVICLEEEDAESARTILAGQTRWHL